MLITIFERCLREPASEGKKFAVNTVEPQEMSPGIDLLTVEVIVGTSNDVAAAPRT